MRAPSSAARMAASTPAGPAPSTMTSKRSERTGYGWHMNHRPRSIQKPPTAMATREERPSSALCARGPLTPGRSAIQPTSDAKVPIAATLPSTEEKKIRPCGEIRGQSERRQMPRRCALPARPCSVPTANAACPWRACVSCARGAPRACASQRRADAPDADADQSEPHQPLAPGGDGLDRQCVAQHQYQEPDAENSSGVTESPPNPGPPGAPLAVHCVRRDRGEVIRSGKHMDEPGDETRKHERHAIRRKCEITRRPHAFVTRPAAQRCALARRLRERGVSRSFPVSRSKREGEQRSVADPHEEGRRVVGVRFRPSRQHES